MLLQQKIVCMKTISYCNSTICSILYKVVHTLPRTLTRSSLLFRHSNCDGYFARVARPASFRYRKNECRPYSRSGLTGRECDHNVPCPDIPPLRSLWRVYVDTRHAADILDDGFRKVCLSHSLCTDSQLKSLIILPC